MIEQIINRLKLTWRVLLSGDRTLPARADVRQLTEAEVAEARAFFPREKFFIFGHARSGTTLLNRLVRVHPDVHSNRQAHFFTRPPFLHALVADPAVTEWLQRGSFRWNRGEDPSPVVLRAAADFILERDARRVGKSIVGDKSPNNLLNGQAVQLMHKIYPDARLIFIVRDGRDAALSHRFQTFIDAPQHLTRKDQQIRQAFEEQPDRFLSPSESLFTETGIRREAENWTRNVTETRAMGRKLYGDRYLDLRFEDLLADPVREMARIWLLLGAAPNADGLARGITDTLEVNRDAKWQEKKAGDMAEAIPKGQKGSWREYFSERDKSVFREIAKDVLIEWGYADKDW